MPELPEVETVRRQLEAVLPGWTLTGVAAVEPSMLRGVLPRDIKKHLCGRTLGHPRRKGKFLLLPLSGGVWLTLHLGMTGRLLVPSGRRPRDAHDRFVFALAREGQKAWFVFRDARKFGRVELSEGGPASRVSTLGPDGWMGEWGADYLAGRFKGRRAAVKALLLDQRILAGVGNIYADEALFEAGILPSRPAGSLNHAELERLAAAVRSTLDRGVRALGCSVSDFLHVDGGRGSMQEGLRAYRRQGLACTRCGATMERTIIAGRGTGYCPCCQR